MLDYADRLNPEKALIWRIVHVDNLPWIWQHGLHSPASGVRSPSWVSIGSDELITKRASHLIPVTPHGTLNDYVPFYFTPFSPMLLNIHTGRGGIKQRRNEEIAILVASLRKVHALKLLFVFTDTHAYYQWANYYTDLADLQQIDWPILQRRDFKRDPDDPAKFERYQAEALIHRHLPASALMGVVVFNASLRDQVNAQIASSSLQLQAIAQPGWYFS